MKTLFQRFVWLPPVLMVGAMVMSASFSLRVYREEQNRLNRLKTSLGQLLELQGPVQSTEAIAGKLEDPLADLNPVLVATLQSNGPMEHRDVGGGWIRHSSSYSISSLPPGLLGKLLEALQAEGRGWWVTGLTLEIREEGLAGQLRLEALDKGTPEE